MFRLPCIFVKDVKENLTISTGTKSQSSRTRNTISSGTLCKSQCFSNISTLPYVFLWFFSVYFHNFQVSKIILYREIRWIQVQWELVITFSFSFSRTSIIWSVVLLAFPLIYLKQTQNENLSEKLKEFLLFTWDRNPIPGKDFSEWEKKHRDNNGDFSAPFFRGNLASLQAPQKASPLNQHPGPSCHPCDLKNWLQFLLLPGP